MLFRSIRKIVIETLSNADTFKYMPVWNTETKSAVDSGTSFWQPLPINFTLLQTDLTPEHSQGICFIGGDFEATSPYEYIFKTPKEFQGNYKFRLVQPELTSVSNSAINQYSSINAPKDNFYVAVKLTF